MQNNVTCVGTWGKEETCAREASVIVVIAGEGAMWRPDKPTT